MKKIFLIFTVIIAVLIAGCAGSPELAGTAQTVLSAQSAFFNGFWKIPDGKILYVDNNAFLLLDNTGSITGSGVIRITDTDFILIFDADAGAVFNYQIVFKDMNVTSDDGNESADGIWTRHDGKLGTDNPIEGYWEYSNSGEISIFHIIPGGFGFFYICDADFFIDKKYIILYDGARPSELYVILSYYEDGQPYETAVLSVIYQENDAIMIKIGGELIRFVKR